MNLKDKSIELFEELCYISSHCDRAIDEESFLELIDRLEVFIKELEK